MNILEQKSVEQKLQVLQFKNRQLSSQLDAQRQQISQLERQLTELEADKQNYNQTLLCINRVWDQLNGDIQHLCNAFAVSVSGQVKHESTIKADESSITDPFLRKLLELDGGASDFVSRTAASIVEELSATEAKLIQRSHATRDSLSHVLEALNTRHSTLFAALSEHHFGDDSISKSLLGERETLTQQISHYKAVSSVCQEEVKLQRDRMFEYEQTIQKLQNQLADTEERVNVLHKKVSELRNTNAAPVVAAQPTAEPPKASTSTNNDADVAAEVQELQQLLEKRTVQLEKEREQNAKLQRQLDETHSKLNDENWVSNTRVYHLKEKESKMLGLVLEQKLKEIESLAKERDEAVLDALQKERFALAEQQASKRVALLETQLTHVLEAKAEVERVKQEVEVQLQKDREKLGNAQTVNELKTMVCTLQKENTMLQKQMKQNKVSADRIEAAAREVQEMVGKLDAKEMQIKRLQEQLGEKNKEIAEVQSQEAAMKDRMEDLRAFVDVLVDFCNDPRDVAEVRTSEMRLQEQVSSLQAQLEGSTYNQKLAELEKEKAQVRDSVTSLKAESDNLRLEANRLHRTIATMKEQLNAVRSECDAYKEEIEGAGSAYEDMQGQNSRLLQQLTERDEANSQLVAERIKLNQQQQGLRAELEAAGSNLAAMNQKLMDQQATNQAMEKTIIKLTQDINQAREQLRVYISKIELLTKDVRDKDEAILTLEVKLEAAQKQVAEKLAAIEQETERTQKEANKRQRLEDDLKLVGAKVDKLRRQQAESESINELEEEVDAMRKLLNCNVCNTNQKNVIITKCWHMFCQPCIKKNLDARHRKCPGCGAPFGQTDVKTFFFT